MAGAVMYGHRRSVRMNFSEESILGKTRNMFARRTRFGWFASYANTDIGRIVTVVFLQGGHPTFGPKRRRSRDACTAIFTIHKFFVAGAPGTTFRSGSGESQHRVRAAGIIPLVCPAPKRAST